MEKIEELIKKILELYNEGYTKKTIIYFYGEELCTNYGVNNDYLEHLIKTSSEKLRKSLPEVEYQKIVNKRAEIDKKLAFDKSKKIADKVKSRIDALDSPITKKQYSDILWAVARLDGKKDSSDVKKCFELVYPEESKKLETEFGFTPEKLLDFASKIIEKDIPKHVAAKTSGYNAMMDYVQNNHPDIYQKILNVYASHGKTPAEELNMGIFAPKVPDLYKNKDILINILLKYRVPYIIAIKFINDNSDIFLTKPNSINLDNFYETLIDRTHDRQEAVRWYLNEMASVDDFTDYRVAKFNVFLFRFNELKSDITKLRRFMESEVRPDANLMEKIQKRNTEERLDLTQEELTSLLNYIYVNALTDEELEYFIKYSKTTKARFIERLEDTENIDNQMLLKGLEKLNEYKLDKITGPGRN